MRVDIYRSGQAGAGCRGKGLTVAATSTRNEVKIDVPQEHDLWFRKGYYVGFDSGARTEKDKAVSYCENKRDNWESEAYGKGLLVGLTVALVYAIVFAYLRGWI